MVRNKISAKSSWYLLIIAREVNYFIQTVVVLERPTHDVKPTFALIKQSLEFRLGNTGPFSGIELGQEFCRLVGWAEVGRATHRDGVGIDVWRLRQPWSVSTHWSYFGTHTYPTLRRFVSVTLIEERC